MPRIKKSRARFLHRDVPTEHGCFPGAKCSEHGRRSIVRIRIVHDRDEGLHLCPYRQTNPGPGNFHSLRRVLDNARHLRRRQARLTVDRRDERIADNRLANFAGDT